jgi:hypothetical protein
MFLMHFFVCAVYKKMPRICKYIQSFTQVYSVKSSIESSYIYQHTKLCPSLKIERLLFHKFCCMQDCQIFSQYFAKTAKKYQMTT